MTTDTKSISELLATLTSAVSSATTAFSSDETAFLAPQDGISLLDVKNGLLLSYIQHLVFLIILRIRNTQNRNSETKDTTLIGEEVIKKLIELRVYLERGVRPLEGRLRYQIDKVLRAAEDADRSAANKASRKQKSNSTKQNKRGHKQRNSSDESNSDSPDDNEPDNNSSSIEDSEEEDQIDEENYRPNTAALARAAASSNNNNPQISSRNPARETSSVGAYRPPRNTPTAMPDVRSRDRDSRPERRRKSNLLSEYIDDELSTAPAAQPSIGSNNTILAHGRSGLSARDRAKERERIEYEERNFTRLPAESKKERQKTRARERSEGKRDMFGGEDWTGLGGLGDRLSRTVKSGRRGEGRGEDDGMSVLQRREKRKREAQEGQRGDGMGGGVSIGDSFEKKRRILQGRAEKKMNKSRR